jgi:hypothetical protein
MSAALHLPMAWEPGSTEDSWQGAGSQWEQKPAAEPEMRPAQAQAREPAAVPEIGLAFYRKHTESMLRRYLYASMQVGRSPSILSDPVCRGWASSRPVRTFEDAVIFVLDIERCLDKLGALDRQLLSRIVLQEYTQCEAAALLGMAVRTVSYKFPQALDKLTGKLLEAGLLILPR